MGQGDGSLVPTLNTKHLWDTGKLVWHLWDTGTGPSSHLKTKHRPRPLAGGTRGQTPCTTLSERYDRVTIDRYNGDILQI